MRGRYECFALIALDNWRLSRYINLAPVFVFQVMGVDVSPDGKLIATCSYDRTFKLWLSE